VRIRWALLLVGIVAAGLLSRTASTGLRLIDKYLGDVLYAAMVYGLLRLAAPGASRIRISGAAAIAMVAIECFQLTGIPAALVRSDWMIVRLCGRLLGTHFSVLDLLAYAVGIASITGFEHFVPVSRACGRNYWPSRSREKSQKKRD
jgi:hypothetical protein